MTDKEKTERAAVEAALRASGCTQWHRIVAYNILQSADLEYALTVISQWRKDEQEETIKQAA